MGIAKHSEHATLCSEDVTESWMICGLLYFSATYVFGAIQYLARFRSVLLPNLLLRLPPIISEGKPLGALTDPHKHRYIKRD
jgi:hypothetical protein